MGAPMINYENIRGTPRHIYPPFATEPGSEEDSSILSGPGPRNVTWLLSLVSIQVTATDLRHLFKLSEYFNAVWKDFHVPIPLSSPDELSNVHIFLLAEFLGTSSSDKSVSPFIFSLDPEMKDLDMVEDIVPAAPVQISAPSSNLTLTTSKPGEDVPPQDVSPPENQGLDDAPNRIVKPPTTKKSKRISKPRRKTPRAPATEVARPQPLTTQTTHKKRKRAVWRMVTWFDGAVPHDVCAVAVVKPNADCFEIDAGRKGE
ncbi:hypothetical protein FB451DRAFT_1188283 [Mycena latifolia]|nr:hypothetical protein FB451DRAFT_1188283 [Mycena latifolia]